MKYHITRWMHLKASLDDPIMAGFVGLLAEINALDHSPVIWRLLTSGRNATRLRPFDDDRILVNMSV